MPYVITFVDDPGVTERKRAFRPAHLEYVIANAERIIASGGFFPDDDDFPNGGLIILDVETRAEAEQYITGDPFFSAGIFSKYMIRRWKKAIFDHRRVSI